MINSTVDSYPTGHVYCRWVKLYSAVVARWLPREQGAVIVRNFATMDEARQWGRDMAEKQAQRQEAT